jgi:TPR repeat protein
MRKQHPVHPETPFYHIEIMRKNDGWREHFLHTSLCLLIAVAVCALSGCTAAVPYAISAAQMVTSGNTLTQSGGASAQPNGSSDATAQAAEARAQQEEALPSQLIAEKKYDEALPMLRERADNHDAKAQGQLALLYLEGNGVPEDYSKAAEWMLKSAEGGYASSQYMLAWFYYKGIGVPQDYTITVEWAEKSLAKGDANAATLLARLYRLGRGVPKDYNKALELLNMADRAGNIYAPASIAYMYKTGQGVSRDYRQAIDWYSKAAEKGNVSGWVHLAYLYATCQETQYVDGKKAVAYALKATEKDPNHFASWAALAAAYARNNEFEKAIEAATKSDSMLQANTKLGEAEKHDATLRAHLRLAAYKESKAYTEDNEADEEN